MGEEFDIEKYITHVAGGLRSRGWDEAEIAEVMAKVRRGLEECERRRAAERKKAEG